MHVSIEGQAYHQQLQHPAALFLGPSSFSSSFQWGQQLLHHLAHPTHIQTEMNQQRAICFFLAHHAQVTIVT